MQLDLHTNIRLVIVRQLFVLHVKTLRLECIKPIKKSRLSGIELNVFDAKQEIDKSHNQTSWTKTWEIWTVGVEERKTE